MRSTGLGVFAAMALILAAIGGSAGDLVSLIAFLVIGGFLGVLAVVQYDQDRNHKEKFGDDTPNKRGRRRGAAPKRMRLLLSGTRWHWWALGLAICASALVYLALWGSPFGSPGPATPEVAESVQTQVSSLASPAVAQAVPTLRSANGSAEKPALVAAQAQVNETATLTTVSAAYGAAAGEEQRLQVRAAIEAWSKAWSAGNADEYLARYSNAFIPADGVTRDKWEATRRLRVQKGRNINVSIEQLAIEFRGQQQAQAVFRQEYQAKDLQNTTNKTLSLVQANGQWKITSEVSVPVSVAAGKNP